MNDGEVNDDEQPLD
jgi:hypothetical protein